MDAIKTAAITFIALATSLIFLPTSELDRTESAERPLPLEMDGMLVTPREMPALVESGLDSIIESRANWPVEQVTPATPIDETDREQLDDWPLLLYPELEQIKALEELPAATALTELLPMLSNADPVVRLATLESLMDMNHLALLPTLSAALDDVDSQVRILALQALGTLDEPGAISSIEPYLYDRETDVRLAAIEALSNLENEQAARTLAGLLSDQDANIRHRAVNALGEIGGEQAIAFLRQARFDPDADIRANAITILDELGETAW